MAGVRDTIIAFAALGAATIAPADACTRILWNEEGKPVVVGRTMDWPESTEPVLTVLPRGLPHDGGLLGTERAVAENPARWTSKYGSVVTTVYGLGAADGFNEKGLGAHLLYLTATDFGPRDTALAGVQAGLWAQYLLDNAATVAEALELMKTIQPVMIEAHGRKATVHLALEDAGGDSAIVEFIDGKPVVHHGREFTVMTNDPSYDQHLALLASHDFSDPSSTTPLPGNVSPTDRFVRASYFRALLPEPETQREAIAGILAIARNVSVPFGAPYRGFGIYNTEYRTAMDLTNQLYFFELTTSPNVVWVDLGAFDLAPGSPVMALDPDNIALSGDVSAAFRQVPAPY